MSNEEQQDEIEVGAEEQEQLSADEQEETIPAEAEQHEQEGDDSVVVTIGDEKPPQEEEQAKAPAWVKELRKSHREAQKRIRELEAQLSASKGGEKPQERLGAKPTLEGLGYDEQKYEEALAKWYEQKRQIDEQTAKAKAEQEEADKAWQQRLAGYNSTKAALKVADYEDAEAAAQEVLSVTQQAIIVQGAKNPALLMYAIGKNQAKAKELAAITDPVKYAWAAAELETQLKVTPKKSPPPPERTVSGTGRAGAIDSQLERLRAEAEKTGDYSKVVRYKQQQKQKQRA